MPLISNIHNNKTFNNLTLSNKNLRNKEFSNCTFKKCNFTESKFSGSIFIDCTFSSCDLSNIKVDDSSFQDIVFENCKLIWIIFSSINALLVSWKFKKCIVELCNFNWLEMKNTLFLDCIICESDFINSNLFESDFRDSDLYLSKFFNTNLEKANFVWARNYYINPIQNKIKKAKFSNPDVLNLLVEFEIDIEY